MSRAERIVWSCLAVLVVGAYLPVAIVATVMGDEWLAAVAAFGIATVIGIATARLLMIAASPDRTDEVGLFDLGH